MTLYLKYRPKNLDELDLVAVSESLKKIVKSGNIPHAFLFAGPKGTGKTSAARILAKIINCESKNPPCGKCEQCVSISSGNNLDVIEMDAASHRGIDDVRSLRDAVKLSPVKAKKKIYIIDEAHMLTVEASNALLKTLEEPPPHVIFILATTNPEKLIDTIRSRTTFIPFKKATPPEIVNSLKRVAKAEKIKIKDDSLEIIAEFSDGSFRDAIKILEQLVSEKVKFDKESLEEHLLSKKSFDLDSFISLLAKKDLDKIIEQISKLETGGASVEGFLESLLRKLRSSLLGKIGNGSDDLKEVGRDDLIRLIEVLIEASKKIADSPIEILPLEIAMIRWCDNEIKSQNSKIKIDKGETLENDSASSRSATSADQDPAQTIAPSVREQVTSSLEGGVNDEIWRNILSLIKPINASVEALLRAARPVGYDGKTLTLGVFYKFHKERLEDVTHRRVLEDIVGQVLKSPTRVVCTLVEPPPKKIIEEAKAEPVLTEGKDADIIKVAEEIFGN